MLICPVITANASADFTLALAADKTSGIKVGDIISVTLTPTDIAFDEGICSYDVSELSYDADVLSFDADGCTVSHSDFEIYTNQTENGKIKIMVVDMSLTGAQLYDGQGAATLKFEVIAQAEKTVISATNGVINGTVANAALDSCPGAAGTDLVLTFGGTTAVESDTDASSQDPVASNEGNTVSAEGDENTQSNASANESQTEQSDASNAASDSSSASAAEDNENSSSTWIWILLIVLIAAVAVGGVVFLIKKKSAE